MHSSVEVLEMIEIVGSSNSYLEIFQITKFNCMRLTFVCRLFLVACVSPVTIRGGSAILHLRTVSARLNSSCSCLHRTCGITCQNCRQCFLLLLRFLQLHSFLVITLRTIIHPWIRSKFTLTPRRIFRAAFPALLVGHRIQLLNVTLIAEIL